MLHRLLQDPVWDVVGLFATFNRQSGRIALHGVRIALLRQQAHSIGISLTEIDLPFPCDNRTYEAAVDRILTEQRQTGIEAVAFGDLFLEDTREYRERQLADTGLDSVFPIWGEKTDDLGRQMIAAGLRAVVTCVDSRELPPDLSGRHYDESFLGDLPADADPCGENGEFHTFVYDGPIFREPIPHRMGEKHESDGFDFTELIPDPETGTAPDS